MSRGVNKVILIGNATKDAETRHMPNGKAVSNVTIATSEGWKDKNTGEQKETTEFHRLVFFDKLAEVVGQYVKKGSKIYVEGRLQTRSWEKDGAKQYTTEIVCNEMQLLDRRDNSQPAASKPGNAPQVATKDAFDDFDDSDIPF